METMSATMLKASVAPTHRQAKTRLPTNKTILRGKPIGPSFTVRSTNACTVSASRHVHSPVVAVSSAGTVRIIIQGRHMEVTDAMREYVEKKISKAVEKFEQTVKEVDVRLSVRGGDTGTKGDKQQKTEVTIHTLRNGIVRSENVADNMYASIDLVCDKIQRKMRKVKEKAISKGKWPGRGGGKGGPKVGSVLETAGEPLPLDKEMDLGVDIVRTKYFHLEPMTEQEAADQLEKLDHDFYVFRDKKSDEVQVLYKRKEYGYGLIIPVVKQ